MNDLKVHISKTSSAVKTKVLPINTSGSDKGCIFQDRSERKIAQTYGNGDKFFRATLSSETDLVFMVTCFFLQAPGREW